jgi:hypothetical protein
VAVLRRSDALLNGGLCVKWSQAECRTWWKQCL